ncbi:TOBE domain-containing protein [Demequina sp.]|uniref:TOBE domain-containing protein n=1 Tax=Demequina sp. TaxID=2050685 RepID=UPI0025BA7351|nr:TOBE domain-containing protein [Demequina sp.]
MTQLRISEAAALVGVSDDTLRRWVKSHGIATTTDDAGRATVSGADLATYAGRSEPPAGGSDVLTSARNRFVGLVTAIKADTVMAQVDLQCGPFRVVSLMSSEAVRELGLEVGSVATAVVKATTVMVEATPPAAR